MSRASSGSWCSTPSWPSSLPTEIQEQVPHIKLPSHVLPHVLPYIYHHIITEFITPWHTWFLCSCWRTSLWPSVQLYSFRQKVQERLEKDSLQVSGILIQDFILKLLELWTLGLDASVPNHSCRHGCHCGPNSDHLSQMVRFVVRIWLLVRIFNRWYSCLALSENFDGLSLTGAKIFAFKICLENHTNFEEKNSVFTRWNQHH